MSKRSVFINTDAISESETAIIGKKPRTDMIILNEGDLITFNGSIDRSWMLGIACAQSKVLVVYESNILLTIDVLNSLKTYLIERKDTLDTQINFEEHIKTSNSYKILSVCGLNNFDILNLNLFYPPNHINSIQFLDILQFNLEVIRNLNVGDIIKFNKNGIFYQAGIYTDKSRCQIAHCNQTCKKIKSECYNYKSSKNPIRYGHLLELANGKLEIGNNFYENAFHLIPLPEKEILNRIENAFENFGQYDRIFNNCEHFVTDARYGTRKSQQIFNILHMIYVIYMVIKK